VPILLKNKHLAQAATMQATVFLCFNMYDLIM